jgi:hypothetical protein
MLHNNECSLKSPITCLPCHDLAVDVSSHFKILALIPDITLLSVTVVHIEVHLYCLGNVNALNFSFIVTVFYS